MKILLGKTVLAAARERIAWVFQEFPHVLVGVSGGKDSTVIWHLALSVARELGRLPLRTFFLDQEAEWSWTIEHMRYIMGHPDVDPLWLQMPIRMSNATSLREDYLWCWREGDTWLRDKEPGSVHANRYGEDRFHRMFTAIIRGEYPGERAAYIAGMRAEESPGRLMGMTVTAKYKHVTWGRALTKGQHYTFYPIYDWQYRDVWHYIAEHNVPYNRAYDEMFRYGVPIPRMRVSNLHHETAVPSLFYLQELDPALYEALAARLAGVDTAGKMGWADYYAHNLPFMFRDWAAYRDHLIATMIPASHAQWAEDLRTWAAYYDAIPDESVRTKAARVLVQSVLANDVEGTKITNFNTEWGKIRQRIHWMDPNIQLPRMMGRRKHNAS